MLLYWCTVSQTHSFIWLRHRGKTIAVKGNYSGLTCKVIFCKICSADGGRSKSKNGWKQCSWLTFCQQTAGVVRWLVWLLTPWTVVSFVSWTFVLLSQNLKYLKQRDYFCWLRVNLCSSQVYFLGLCSKSCHNATHQFSVYCATHPYHTLLFWFAGLP